MSTDYEVSAVRTLLSLGYTFHGGEQWKPPLGKKPTWLDDAKVHLSEAGSYVADPTPPARASTKSENLNQQAAILASHVFDAEAGSACEGSTKPKYTGPVQPSEVHALSAAFADLGLFIEGKRAYEVIRAALECRYIERGLP
jgi:hypothetical protein